ncbi:putative bifunctional diguanylate cyclase/phosphodiesterase [Pseudorhodoplanes sinuspersici]|uniref:GGDEF-domain containing protein n=1 Tax=Pseudorhodoplanes sinuspersici TaxID=1235591 RepID=A0A1W6ZPV8_9HYPH|nr:bifunctional diguanylate cyclase/phosphodiesterase [Pseudorhodoplanes sinuspersici]ARP99436.1 GGDEF-domain containing protein [Pseudorhodoplanes sinuspersici]
MTKATKTSRPVEAKAGADKSSVADAASEIDVAAILRSSGEAAYEWRIEADTLTWSSNAPALLGLRDTGPISTGRGFAMLLDPGNTKTRFDAVTHSTKRDQGKGVAYQVEYALRSNPRAPKRWIEDTGRWFAGKDGKPERAHGVIRVINDRHKREEQLAYLSRFDPLTGEINRWHLTEQLEKALQETARAKTNCGFLLVAIDGLGQVNEAYGYDIADEVIGIVARRLRSKMRGEDCLGRFSGNKFGLILRNCTPDEIGVAAERFLSHVRHDVVMTSAGPIAVTGTIGSVVAPRHGGNVHDVLARAQETLDLAKEKRPGSFLVYQPNIEREAMRRENILATDKIVTALNQRRIMLAYEPVVDAQTHKGVFYECLLRIRSTDGVMISAADIMPVAERLGLVRLLDQRVLELVVAEMAAHPSLHASVNVSAASTFDPDWWARLEALLRLHRSVAERLIIEITETMAIHDIDNARGFVARVKDLGARIAIDDFGAGFTSFRNLRKLGVDMIKIDGAFVQNLKRSADDRTFVRTMLDLARGLKLKSVAEWVPDKETAAMLAAWGCDYLQGGYVGHASIDRPPMALHEKRAVKL